MSGDKEQFADLVALSQMRDADIDLDDIPETVSFAGARRGRFDPLLRRDFDVRAIANWFVDRAKAEKLPLSKVWANKLTYLAYETGISEFGAVLTPARAEAWNFGPVFREIYSQYEEVIEKGYFQKFSMAGRTKVKAEADFSPSDLQILEMAWERYSRMGAAQLTQLTHAEGTPWKTVWDLGGKLNPGMVIDPAIILGRSGGQMYGKQ